MPFTRGDGTNYEMPWTDVLLAETSILPVEVANAIARAAIASDADASISVYSWNLAGPIWCVILENISAEATQALLAAGFSRCGKPSHGTHDRAPGDCPDWCWSGPCKRTSALIPGNQFWYFSAQDLRDAAYAKCH